MELGGGEILVILAIVLLLFGPSKLPKLGEGLGSAMRNFRNAMRGDDEPRSTPAARPPPPALPAHADAAEAPKPAQAASTPEPAHRAN